MTNDLHILLDQAHRHATDYISGVADQRVFPDQTALRALDRFDMDLPENGLDPAAMLDLLHEAGAPNTSATTGGRYFGFVNGGIHPPALAARWIADTWDQNAALHVMSPVASKLEALCETWLADLLDLPTGTAAGLVGGTSVSLVCGLAAARHAVLARQNWNVGRQGLVGAPPVRIVLGDQAHGSVFRAPVAARFRRGECGTGCLRRPGTHAPRCPARP